MKAFPVARSEARLLVYQLLPSAEVAASMRTQERRAPRSCTGASAR